MIACQENTSCKGRCSSHWRSSVTSVPSSIVPRVSANALATPHQVTTSTQGTTGSYNSNNDEHSIILVVNVSILRNYCSCWSKCCQIGSYVLQASCTPVLKRRS